MPKQTQSCWETLICLLVVWCFFFDWLVLKSTQTHTYTYLATCNASNQFTTCSVRTGGGRLFTYGCVCVCVHSSSWLDLIWCCQSGFLQSTNIIALIVVIVHIHFVWPQFLFATICVDLNLFKSLSILRKLTVIL